MVDHGSFPSGYVTLTTALMVIALLSPRGAGLRAGPFSQWPESLGLAAIGDADLMERFGEISRQEYTAVGLRVAPHPQIDLATEPRWARQVATFGEDAEPTWNLAAAYIRGFEWEPWVGNPWRP